MRVAAGPVAAAVLALVALVPVTVAQAPLGTATFQVGPMQAPAYPIQVDGSVLVTVPWTYTFGNAAEAAATEAADGSLVLQWQAPACTPAAGMSVTGALSEVIRMPPPETGETVLRGSSFFTVAASSLAPGEVQILCSFTGHVNAGATVSSTAPATGSVPVTVRYRGLVSATAPVTILQATPGVELPVKIQVQNLGNSDSAVDFSLRDGIPADWRVVVPPQVILTSPNNGGTANGKDLQLELVAPAHANQQTFQVLIQPHSTKDSTDLGKGQPIALTFLVRVRDCTVTLNASACPATQAGAPPMTLSGKSAAGTPALPLASVLVAAAAFVGRRRS